VRQKHTYLWVFDEGPGLLLSKLKMNESIVSFTPGGMGRVVYLIEHTRNVPDPLNKKKNRQRR